MLEELMKNCTFKEDGLYLNDSGLDPLEVYHFMHSAIADDHLPVSKVCGFNISAMTRSGAQGSVTERNTSVLENILEIAYNLTDKVFLNMNSSMATVSSYEGSLDLTQVNDLVVSNAKYPKILHKSAHILTAIHPVTVKMKVVRGTGYSSMGNTAKKYLPDQSYFPMVVRFSIHDYCKVCPPMYKDKVAYRLFNGMTADDVKYHFLLLYGDKNSLSKEDKIWLSKYEQ